ncbi:hypothetical protein BKA80DRAFT_60385 [Phyllosticta citrichinensis]
MRSLSGWSNMPPWGNVFEQPYPQQRPGCQNKAGPQRHHSLEANNPPKKSSSWLRRPSILQKQSPLDKRYRGLDDTHKIDQECKLTFRFALPQPTKRRKNGAMSRSHRQRRLRANRLVIQFGGGVRGAFESAGLMRICEAWEPPNRARQRCIRLSGCSLGNWLLRASATFCIGLASFGYLITYADSGNKLPITLSLGLDQKSIEFA